MESDQQSRKQDPWKYEEEILIKNSYIMIGLQKRYNNGTNWGNIKIFKFDLKFGSYIWAVIALKGKKN